MARAIYGSAGSGVWLELYMALNVGRGVARAIYGSAGSGVWLELYMALHVGEGCG